MKMDILNEAVETLGRESGVAKVLLYDFEGQHVCEDASSSSEISNFEEIQGRLKQLLLLTSASGEIGDEMLMTMGDYKILLNFLKNSTLILFCTDGANFPSLNEATKDVGMKIYKTIRESTKEIEQEKSSSTKLDKLNLKARSGSLKKTEHPLIVILKKMVVEMEGPVGSIIFKKSLRLSGINPDFLDVNSATGFVHTLKSALSPQNQQSFQKRASLVTMEYFGS